MAKKTQGRHDEVMLIPFLDILCSLIGVLVLIVVAMCVAQLQRVQGRSKEEVQLAGKYQSLLVRKKELEKAAPDLRAKAAAIASREKELAGQKARIAEKQSRIEDLRRKLSASAKDAERNKEQISKVQKEVGDLTARMAALDKEKSPLEAELEKTRRILAEKKAQEKAGPSIVVKPGGSVSKAVQKVFFVEANGAGIVIHKSAKDQVRVARDSVNADKEYNEFLKGVKNSGKSALIFLIRKDGWGSYLKSAGWAEQSFGLNTGKLPIPGDGPLDLSLFGK